MPAPKHFNPLLPLEAYAPTAADSERAAHEEQLGMIPFTAPMLTEPAQPVAVAAIQTPAVQDTIDRLFATASGQKAIRGHAKRRTLVGLAAPQIGELVRIVLIDTTVQASRKGGHKLECFINPEIIWRSRETAEGREGCFSTGLVWGLVRRSVAVKIRAYTPAGKPVERILEGFTACIAQHEIDHLNGIRFPERIRSDAKRHWVHAEEVPQYAKHVKHWPRLCTREQWQLYSNGGLPA
jgi:peptide deformylase